MVSSQHHNPQCDSSHPTSNTNRRFQVPIPYANAHLLHRTSVVDVFNTTYAPISEPCSDSVKDSDHDAVKVRYIVRFWFVHRILRRPSVLETAKELNKVDNALMNLCTARRRIATVQKFFCLDRSLAHLTCRREHGPADPAGSLSHFLEKNHWLKTVSSFLVQLHGTKVNTLESRYDAPKDHLPSKGSSGSTTFHETRLGLLSRFVIAPRAPAQLDKERLTSLGHHPQRSQGSALADCSARHHLRSSLSHGTSPPPNRAVAASSPTSLSSGSLIDLPKCVLGRLQPVCVVSIELFPISMQAARVGPCSLSCSHHGRTRI